MTYTLTTIAVERDHLGDGATPVFVCPPRGAAFRSPGFNVRWRSRQGLAYAPVQRADAGNSFRMLDDDGNVYFEGWWSPGTAGEPGEDPFAVMLEWGMGWAGCTRIEEERDGEWVAVIG